MTILETSCPPNSRGLLASVFRHPRHWLRHKHKVTFRESCGEPRWMISIPSSRLASLPEGTWEDFAGACAEGFSHITIWHTRRLIHIEGEGAPPLVTTFEMGLGSWKFLDQ
jgi:hypothetical protein